MLPTKTLPTNGGAMRNVVGPPVTGPDFFDRLGEMDELWLAMTRSSVLLAAPRRVGKTSLLRQAEANPRAGHRPIYLTLESADRPGMFSPRLPCRPAEAGVCH